MKYNVYDVHYYLHRTFVKFYKIKLKKSIHFTNETTVSFGKYVPTYGFADNL